MNEIRECVNAVRQRQQRQWMWHCASAGLVTAGLAACLLAVARSILWPEMSWAWVVGVLITGPGLGAIYSRIRACAERDAAAAIDRTYELKDRATTALGFLKGSAVPTVWQRLQLEDAKQHLASVEAPMVAPIRAPRSWVWALSITAVALIMVCAGTRTELAMAEIIPNSVVTAQASLLDDSLNELHEFDTDGIDVELEELLRELGERLDQLKRPGVDPREALAGLSEMEFALQEKQRQLESSDTEARLADIGAALSLSDELQVAGEAMANGELDKAAEVLAGLDLPKLDRQTEKAITEKLNDVAINDGNAASRRLKEAAAQTAAGLNKGNRSKFRDGMDGLAGECKKQGRRNKLADLLKKQCRCLSECKSECESECKDASNSKGKGGSDWGTGTTDNDLGESTIRLNADQQMKITGQESPGGETDVETMTAPETAQKAVRRYRNQSDKYEQLTESVLDSEPIPLGHRQTIRRYFKMIRPRSGEVDSVNDRFESMPQQ
jgi:hypothetical protein